MKVASLRSLFVGTCALLASAGGVQASVVSTFDADAEGWTLANGGVSLTWSNTLGNPGGGISGNDGASNRLWYFSAPAAFLGDQSSMLGGSLAWDRRYIGGGSSLAPDSFDIIIHAGSLQIGYLIPGSLDLPTWETLSVPLSSAGWVIAGNFPTPGVGPAVTEAQFAQALAGMTALYIQGEYRNGDDTGALDNVIMTPIPAPGSIACVAIGVVAMTGRRRK